MSYLDLIDDVTLFRGLLRIDTELAASTRSAGCPYCGDALHYAPYQRKPRGSGAEVPAECHIRLSLCCGTCRRRTLPPSALYLGRRVYWGSVVLLVAAAAQGLQRCTINELTARFGATRRTIKRWVEFFRVAFPRSEAWERLRGHVSAAVANEQLPRSLLAWWFAAGGRTVDTLVRVLHMIASGP